MSSKQQGQGALPVLYFTIPDLDTLAAHYLGFLENGGIFLPSPTGHTIGESVVVLLTLGKPARRFAICSTVFLQMPEKSGQKYTGGTGFSFTGNENSQARAIGKLLDPLKAERSFCQVLAT